MNLDPGQWILLALIPFVGAAAGFAGGLFGIGGGFVVVPALLLILPGLGASPEHLLHAAVGTSLCTIIFTSLRATASQARRGAVDAGTLRAWAPWLVAGTVLGSGLADALSSAALATVFGVCVLLFSLQFLLPTMAGRQVTSTLPGGAARGALAGGLGAVSTLLGIGGGTVATITMTLCGVPIHRAIATASGMGAIIAIPGTLGFILTGLDESGLPPGSLGYVNLPVALAVVATSILFAPLGVAAAHRLSEPLLRRAFGAYLLLVGVTMLAEA